MGARCTQCIFHRSPTYQYRNEDGDQNEDINVRKWEKCNPRRANANAFFGQKRAGHQHNTHPNLASICDISYDIYDNLTKCLKLIFIEWTPAAELEGLA